MHPYLIEQIASQRVTEMRHYASQRRLAATTTVREPRTPATQPVRSWTRIQSVMRHALRAA